jgi:hypothetical protein
VPQTLTVDNVDVPRIALVRLPDGTIQIFAEYTIRAGSLAVQTEMKPLEAATSALRQAAAAALFAGIAADVSARELSKPNAGAGTLKSGDDTGPDATRALP